MFVRILNKLFPKTCFAIWLKGFNRGTEQITQELIVKHERGIPSDIPRREKDGIHFRKEEFDRGYQTGVAVTLVINGRPFWRNAVRISKPMSVISVADEARCRKQLIESAERQAKKWKAAIRHLKDYRDEA